MPLVVGAWHLEIVGESIFGGFGLQMMHFRYAIYRAISPRLRNRFRKTRVLGLLTQSSDFKNVVYFLCWSRIPHLPCVTSTWHLDSLKNTLPVQAIFLKKLDLQPIYFMLEIQPLDPSRKSLCFGFALKNHFPHLLMRDMSRRILLMSRSGF